MFYLLVSYARSTDGKVSPSAMHPTRVQRMERLAPRRWITDDRPILPLSPVSASAYGHRHHGPAKSSPPTKKWIKLRPPAADRAVIITVIGKAGGSTDAASDRFHDGRAGAADGHPRRDGPGADLARCRADQPGDGRG